jgi:superfamily II DNA helicase RecQ
LTALGRDFQQARAIIEKQLKLPEKLLSKQKDKRKPRAKPFGKRPAPAKPVKARKTRSAEKPKIEPSRAFVSDSIDLISALKAWRLQKAHRSHIPAFRILTDRVVTAIAASKPTTNKELLAIAGFGPKLLEKYGSDIISMVRNAGKV